MAEVIKNYVFNKDKSFVIFNNKYYVVARHLIKIKDFEDGIHPNDSGAKKMADVIEKFIRNNYYPVSIK